MCRLRSKIQFVTIGAILTLCLLLPACDTTPPAPNQQQNTPTPPPPHTAEEVIARAKQVFAAETAHSYVITETNTFTQTIPPSGSGDKQETERGEQVEYKAWYQAPTLWRTETTAIHTDFYVHAHDTLTTTSKPITTIEVNDGVDFWLYYVNTKQALASTGQGVRQITEPNGLSDSYEYEEGATSTTRDLLAYISECYTPTLKGNDTVAGRAAYVIALAPKCFSNASSYYTAPRMVWLDQERYLLLKDVLYFDAHSDWGKSTWVREVKTISVKFNVPIPAVVFSFTPPAGADLIDNRPLPGGLAQARQQLKFPVFVPTYVPNGLYATPPYLFDRTAEPAVQLHYYNVGYVDVIFISEDAVLENLKPLHPTDEPVTLPNGITAYYRNGADWCNDTWSFIYWVQDGTNITVSTSSFGGADGTSSLSKDELIKVAASMSSTADLGKTAWPPYRTYAPTSNSAYIAPTPCPTPHR